MKLGVNTAIVGGICLGMTAWLVTQTLHAQQPRSGGRQPVKAVRRSAADERIPVARAVANPTETKRTTHPGPDEAQANRSILDGKFVASHGTKAFEVAVADGVASVHSQVSLNDAGGQKIFVWRVTVLDAAKSVVAQRLYDDQVFALPEVGFAEPTFDDKIEVAPDAAYLQLSLFAVRRGKELTDLKDKQKSLGYLVLRSVKKL